MSDWLDNTDNWLGGGSGQKKNVKKKLDDNIDEALKKQPGVPYFVLKCPKCNSDKIRCYCSTPPVRYHKCNDCEWRFKSVEQELM